MKRYHLLLAVAATLIWTACDQVSIDEVIDHEPVITAFSPMTAPVGAEITVTGESLQNVTEAYIGSVRVEIASKVSNKLLTLRVVEGVTSGPVKLVSPAGSGLSSASFQCSFAVPSIKGALLQPSAALGDEILLSGEYLNSAKAVIFTAVGYDKGHEAQILTRSDKELIVIVPYVESADARITLRYFDGSKDLETARDNAPGISITRYVPTFNPYTFEKTAVGRSITLTGEYLNNVDRITVGDYEAQVFKSASELSFTVPAGEFPDGDSVVPLKAWYFDNNESLTLAESFTVFVPFVRFWQNIEMWCDGRVEENSFASFFCPENGKLYANEKWKTDLDPVAFKLFGTQFGSANQPKPGMISDEEYNSVLPYFFFSSVSGNVLQLNGPANSNGQIKNFFINAANPAGTTAHDNRVPGSNSSVTGTPIVCFRYLDPGNAVENELITKVINDQIEKINEELFPIDVENSKIAGISVTSLAGGIKSENFCDHQTKELVDDPGYKRDIVFLVAYYHNYGYNPDARAKNIKRLGLLHIKQIDWGVFNNKFASSKVLVDCYWQKYDYDYSKLN